MQHSQVFYKIKKEKTNVQIIHPAAYVILLSWLGWNSRTFSLNEYIPEKATRHHVQEPENDYGWKSRWRYIFGGLTNCCQILELFLWTIFLL